MHLMGRALIIAATPRKVAACSRWGAYTLKAVRSLSEPPADMQILLSKSLACAPWWPPTSWQMGMNVPPCGRSEGTTQAIGQQHTSPLRARCEDWTTQAIGQQHTSPLRARCEARRREVAVISRPPSVGDWI